MGDSVTGTIINYNWAYRGRSKLKCPCVVAIYCYVTNYPKFQGFKITVIFLSCQSVIWAELSGEISSMLPEV